jgi:hypothetical protein
MVLVSHAGRSSASQWPRSVTSAASSRIALRLVAATKLHQKRSEQHHATFSKTQLTTCAGSRVATQLNSCLAVRLHVYAGVERCARCTG